MKTIRLTAAVLLMVLALFGCSKSTSQRIIGDWKRTDGVQTTIGFLDNGRGAVLPTGAGVQRNVAFSYAVDGDTVTIHFDGGRAATAVVSWESNDAFVARVAPDSEWIRTGTWRWAK